MMLQTWVARFVVDHGKVTEEGGRLRTFQRRRLDEPEVDLHILAEPAGAKGEDLGAQALDAIGRLFLQERLSLTGGLLRALRSTHQTLLDWNRRSVPREQVSVGVSGAIVSGNVVYVAQVGPSLVFFRRDGALERFVLEEAGRSPLGEGEVEPELRRLELAPGDLLLAASPVLETIVDAALLNTILERGSDEALPELYLLTRDLPSFALFAVTCFESEAEDGQPATPEEETLSHEAASIAPSTPRVPRLGFDPKPDMADEAPADPVVTALTPPLDISRPLVRLRSDQSVGRSDYARTTGPPPRFRLDIARPRFAILGAALAVLLFVGAFTVPDLIREGRGEKLETLISEAQTQLDAALADAGPAAKRRHLEETRRLAAEALRIEPLNTTAAGLHQQATTSLNALDAILDLGPMTTLTTLSRQITGEVSIEGLTVAAGNAYLLDAKGGRIISVPLAATAPPAVIFQEGETYRGTPAKKPAFATWQGSDRGGRLLVLDAERKLFEIRPGSFPEPLPLRRTNTWSSVAGLAAYDGNLYVLDPGGNQVHRYLPAAAGFDSEPGAAVSGRQSLGDAVGIAVDGDIYLVLRDGRVRRFRSGSDAGFSFGGIDRPLKSAGGIAIVSGAEEVYVVDSGNKRVVVAAKDGTFRRQLVSNAFTDLRAIGVDGAGAQLYVVVGDALLTAPIVR